MAKPRALNGRAATQEDVDAGEVIFFVPDGRSEPYKFDRDLPLQARLISSAESTGFAAGTIIEILQAEVGDTGDVLIGFVAGDEQGICMLHEIELVQ